MESIIITLFWSDVSVQSKNLSYEFFGLEISKCEIE